MVARVKKNDTVGITSGKEKGKQGTVIAILPKKGKVLVKGINIVTKHVKARSANETSGIKKVERFMPIDKTMPICTSCKKWCRIQSKRLENEKLVRICSSCKEIF